MITQIRQLRKEDAQAYLEMLNQLDTETQMMMYEAGERLQSIEKLEGRLEASHIWTCGIIQDEKIIGFISVERGIPNRIRHCGYIVIGILASAQRKGYGKQLFTQAIAYAKANHLTRLELTVMKTNSGAIHLYQKVGFQIEGEKKQSMYVDGVYIDEWTMCYLMEE